MIRSKDNIAHTGNGVSFYHRNPEELLVPEVYIQLQELEDYADEINNDLENRTFGGLLTGGGLVPAGTEEGIYQDTPFKAWNLKSESARKNHHIRIATQIEQAEQIENWKDELSRTVEQSKTAPEKAFEKTISWWNDFWNRRYIIIQPENPEPENPVWQMGRNYQLFRYQLGGNVFGDGWGWQNDQNYRIRGEEIPFGDPRANAATGYNALVEKGVMANNFLAYHWESQIEHAYMILEYHRFTGVDISDYMPFIEQSLIFFDEHYRARQKMRNGKELDENGKLVIFPSTSCESYRGATNPADVLSGLKACLSSMLELDEEYLSAERIL